MRTSLSPSDGIVHSISSLPSFPFLFQLGMGAEGAEQLAKEIRGLVGPSVDDLRIRRLVVRATQVRYFLLIYY